MVELRKRPAPAASNPPPAKKSASTKSAKSNPISAVKKTVDKVVKSVSGSKAPQKGDTIDFAGFGGEVETNDGVTVTLAKLVEDSKAGVVLFTYPKASTPGCTTQACLFRDSYEALTTNGLAIYGLSTDSPKSNTSFKTKHNFPYPLLCDPKATLIAAIGLKKSPSGTQRGVFVVSKDGKVLIAEPGSPAGTFEAVKKLVETSRPASNSTPVAKVDETAPVTEGKGTDAKAANTAAEVADTAAKIDA